MSGLRFEDQPAVVVADPNRADIACFVGFVARRAVPLPPGLVTWLAARWGLPAAEVESHLPHAAIPIDTWEVFDALFAWDRRLLVQGGAHLPTYLGAAVRSFFAQGGRKCYVVPVGEPWAYLEAPVDSAARAARMAARLETLLPGYASGAIDGSPVEPQSWRGPAHLFGLEDVSLLCLPDLPDLVRVPETRIDPPVDTPLGPEQFVVCSAVEPAAPLDRSLRRIAAPRCDDVGYAAWAKAVQLVARFLGRHCREVQCIAALPLPEPGGAAERDPLQFIAGLPSAPLARTPDDTPAGLASAFVQLAFPWLRTGAASGPASGPFTGLPEGLTTPDGVLAGMVARSALVRGAFATVAGQPPIDTYDLVPALRREQVEALQERISLFVLTPSGLRLLSDVTLSPTHSHRQAHTGRLTASLLRSARTLGAGLSFEVASEQLWRQVREQLGWLLEQYRIAGALRGALAQDAYSVRCDRSTMTQNDIDNGRVIAEVRFDPAATVDGITVVLALHEGSRVATVETRAA